MKPTFTNGQMIAELDELKNKFIPYSVIITRAIICIPSNIFFMGFFCTI